MLSVLRKSPPLYSIHIIILNSKYLVSPLPLTSPVDEQLLLLDLLTLADPLLALPSLVPAYQGVPDDSLECLSTISVECTVHFPCLSRLQESA